MIKKFALSNAEIGGVYYIRKDNQVKAVKVVKMSYERLPMNSGHGSYIHIIVAGEGDESVRHYLNCSPEKNLQLYKSVDDCIYDRNAIGIKITSDAELMEATRFGKVATEVIRGLGCNSHGVYKYVWDGYRPKRRLFNLCQFNFYNDGNGWRAEFDKNSSSYNKEWEKACDTYEECIANNSVQVVTF